MLTCTLRDLVPEGAAAGAEADHAVARLKADARMVAAIEPAVRFHESPPTERMDVVTPWGTVLLSAEDWAEAFAARDPGTQHNEARDQVWEALLRTLVDRLRNGSDDPDGNGIEGAVDRYVAMTRSTQRLVVLTSSWYPGGRTT